MKHPPLTTKLCIVTASMEIMLKDLEEPEPRWKLRQRLRVFYPKWKEAGGTYRHFLHQCTLMLDCYEKHGDFEFPLFYKPPVPVSAFCRARQMFGLSKDSSREDMLIATDWVNEEYNTELTVPEAVVAFSLYKSAFLSASANMFRAILDKFD